MNMNTSTQSTNTITNPTILNTRGQDANGSYIFLDYDSKAPVSEAGFRTIPLLYKMNPKTKVAAASNACMLVEPLADEDILANMDSLLAYVKGFLETKQNEIAKVAHVAGLGELTKDSLGITGIIEFLASTRTSTRLNKDIISAWFAEEMQDSLSILFAEKLGFTAESIEADSSQVDKIALYVDVYKGKFLALASNLTTHSVEDATKLLDAMSKCISSDSPDSPVNEITSKIIEKLTKMKDTSSTLMMEI